MTKQTKCNCNDQTTLVGITNSHSAFQNSLNEIVLGDWIKLMECTKCGQLWKINEWDKYQTLYAVKIAEKGNWESFDSESLIKEKMMINRGGLTDTECMWADCNNKQVKTSAYCINHLYETGARK